MFSFGRNKIRESLTRTRNSVFGQITNLFGGGEITEELWEDLEALLIQADVGVETVMGLIETVRERVDREGITRPEQAKAILKEEMQKLLEGYGPSQVDRPRMLTVILVVGVNGSGKTTTIAKLARYYQQNGKRVILAAADTFRAAAIDQLKIWADRANVPIIAHQANADPGAVVFDAIKSALARKMDIVIIDTAGRLHTKVNLMEELRKVNRIIQRRFAEAPHEVLLVLDATTGQNALAQAKYFTEAVGVTGILLAKLDGTAKGGVIFSVCHQLGVPVRFVGTGERVEDLTPFEPRAFVEALFA